MMPTMAICSRSSPGMAGAAREVGGGSGQGLGAGGRPGPLGPVMCSRSALSRWLLGRMDWALVWHGWALFFGSVVLCQGGVSRLRGISGGLGGWFWEPCRFPVR